MVIDCIGTPKSKMLQMFVIFGKLLAFYRKLCYNKYK